MTAIKEQFDAGVKVVQSFAKHGGTFQPSTTMMLTFYAFYKQATQGECHTTKPAFYDVVGRAKWDAWKQLGSMSSEQAMQEYVNELKKIVEAMPQTEVVQDFVEKLGSFYEMVDEREDKTDSNFKRSMIIERDRSCEGDCTFPESQRTKDWDCSSPVEDKNSRLNVNDFDAQKVKWPKHCQANGDISSSETVLIKGSKVANDDKSSENTKLHRNDECQSSGDAYDDDDEDDDNDDDGGDEDDEDEDAGNAEEDGESEEDGDEDEDDSGDEEEISKEMIVNHSIISDDTFDEDEFCDTVDIPFQQEEQSHLLHLMSSSDRVVQESTVKSVCVQTDDSPLQSVAKLHDDKNDEVLSKVSAAVEAMQRNVVELEKQIATLNELHNKKIRLLKVFDFLNQYKVPGLCFVVLWPVVVGLLFNRYSRSSRRS